MDHYDKNENASNHNEVMHSNVVPDINIKSYFSDHLTEDPITPLTKAEEYALKKVRRKLKNKISAQESRRRKKQHLENLEKRVRLLDSENERLRRKLENQDESLRSLTFQLDQAKSAGGNRKEVVSYRSQGTQTGVCLKCYLQKEPANDAWPDFKVQTGKNGRIIVRSELTENQRITGGRYNEYTEYSSVFTSRSVRDRA